MNNIMQSIFLWHKASKQKDNENIRDLVERTVAGKIHETEKFRGPEIIFVSFALEDKHQFDLLKNQSLKTKKAFHYISIPVENVDTPEWKERARTQIQRSDAVLVLVSRNSLRSDKQKKEITLAKEENKRMLGIWAYTRDGTKLKGVRTVLWTPDAIRKFIDRPIAETLKNVFRVLLELILYPF